MLLLSAPMLAAAPARAQSAPLTSAPEVPGTPGRPDPDAGDSSTDAGEPQGVARLPFVLAGFEHFPDRKELDRLAPPAEMIAGLQNLLFDPDQRPLLRLRAIDALSLYAHPDAHLPLGRLAAADHRRDDFPLDAPARTRQQARHRALTALARADHPEAFEIWRDALGQDDLQVRLTAITLLRRHAPERARPHLEKLAATDTRPAVQRALLRPIGGADNAPSRPIP
ncbi:HEAT repeat domain-containing protein [Lujinxingia litoralis]|nr:HEAT repeat domain-containing protein [Lujinxingia litoralis]